MGLVQTSDYVRYSAEKLNKNNLFETPQLVCDIYCLLPGQEQRPHAHVGQAKFYYVIEGAGTFTVGDETRRLGPGGFAWATSGELHGVRNDTQQYLVLLVAIAPRPNVARDLK